MTTPMSEEIIIEELAKWTDHKFDAIDNLIFRSALRSFAAWVIAEGRPENEEIYPGFYSDDQYDEYASAMRKLIEIKGVDEEKPVPSEPFGIRDANPSCAKCHGVGSYSYDENHGKLCELCCGHLSGPYEFHDEAREYLNGYCSNGCGEKLT